MKKFICLIFSCCLVTTIYSQITTREDIVETAVRKPAKFDSLSNLKAQEKICDYKKYIGYQLYCLPHSKKYVYKNEREKYYEYPDGSFFSARETSVVTIPHLSYYEADPKWLCKQFFPDTTKLNKTALASYHKLVDEYEQKFITKTDILYPIYPTENRKYYYADAEDIKFYTNPDSISGHYFTILNFEFKKGDKYYSCENFETNQNYYKLRILLKNDTTGDTLYWNTESNYLDSRDAFFSYMFLVPYFEKQQQLINKSFICMKDIPQKIDVNTGELIDIHVGDKWTCSDVTFVNSKEYRYIHPYYFLKKDNHEITLEFEYFDNEKFFMEEGKYLFLEAEKKKAEEQRIAEEQERERIEKENKLKHEKYVLSKYGVKIGTLINNGQVSIGMNKDMCIEAWGNPLYVNTMIVKNLKHEQWVYNYGKYLYFDNGVLTAIQEF